MKEQLAGFDRIEEASKSNHALRGFVGECLFLRTVTYHLVGRVERIRGKFLELSDASWVADSGRFTQAIRDGELNEVEPVGDAWVNMDTVTDFYRWNHDLPAKQK
jgi:hypothetical protein